MKKNTLKNMFDDNINKQEIYNNVLNKTSKTAYNIMSRLAISIILVIVVVSSIIILNHDNSTSAFIGPSSSKDLLIFINEKEDETYLTYSRKDVHIYSSSTNENNNSNYSTNEKNNITEEASKDITLDVKIAIPQDLELVSLERKESNSDEKLTYTEAIYENKEESRRITSQYSDDDFIIKKYDTTNTKSSKIKNTELTIFKEDIRFIVIYRYKNLYYHIITENITEDELVAFLESTIKE